MKQTPPPWSLKQTSPKPSRHQVSSKAALMRNIHADPNDLLETLVGNQGFELSVLGLLGLDQLILESPDRTDRQSMLRAFTCNSID